MLLQLISKKQNADQDCTDSGYDKHNNIDRRQRCSRLCAVWIVLQNTKYKGGQRCTDRHTDFVKERGNSGNQSLGANTTL